MDRWGQGNISCIGDFRKPKAQMLGVRGFPGNSINHANSMFVPAHSTRAFIGKEVDVVGSVGYNVPMTGVTLGTAGVDLKVHSDVVYNTAVKANDVEVVKAGVSAVQFGVTSNVKAGRLVVTPAVKYQVTLRDVSPVVSENEDNEFWATVGVAYGF